MSEFEQILLDAIENRKWLTLQEAEAVLGNILARDIFLQENLSQWFEVNLEDEE